MSYNYKNLLIFQEYGWEALISEGCYLACSNLQWRSGTASWSIPCAYVSEFTYFSLNPKNHPLLKAFDELKMNLSSVVSGINVS